jgi:hypothetical protein
MQARLSLRWRCTLNSVARSPNASFERPYLNFPNNLFTHSCDTLLPIISFAKPSSPATSAPNVQHQVRDHTHRWGHDDDQM